MLGEKIGEIAGKNYDAACFAESRWRTKNGIIFSGNRISVGHKHKRHRHVLDHFPSRRNAIRRRSMPPKWSRLNKVAVLFEYAVDAEGNTHSEYWEWK